MVTSSNGLVVQAENLIKIYQMGKIKVRALDGVSLDIPHSEVLAIMGPSGSGKSTLMHILSCLDRASGGSYSLDGQPIAKLSDRKLARIRNQKIGFVFQSFNLLSRYTALANVELPLRYAGVRRGVREKATAALEIVGLGDRIHHKPTELSGGQQQRVAIARALVNDPPLLMADEPTGALDTKSGKEIIDLLLKLNAERKTTIILVTHDPGVAARAQRIIRLRDGKIEQGDGE